MVDRAVCMPFAKPQVLRRGHRRRKDDDGPWQTVASIREDVADGASFIVRALDSSSVDRRWSKAELALDPAGPWWSKTRDDYLELDEASQDWVLERIEGTADRAAAALQDRAEQRDWCWLWSQPSFGSPGKLRPTIIRPDLVAGLDWKRCEVIDLKTTGREELRSAASVSLKKSFASWAAALRQLRFDPESSLVLIVSTEHDRWSWIDAPLPDHDSE